ncbi:hypothetical protein P4S73_16400 [Paraglaciecola sp. Hal342]
MQILNLCSDSTATVYIIPNFFMYNLLNARWQSVGSIQTLSVFDTPFQGAGDVTKRLEDIVVSSDFNPDCHSYVDHCHCGQVNVKRPGDFQTKSLWFGW